MDALGLVRTKHIRMCMYILTYHTDHAYIHTDQADHTSIHTDVTDHTYGLQIQITDTYI